MNLREETIKVLRPLAELANDYFEWQPDATQLLTTENIVLTLSDARRARTFLPRLEAGSGEETDWQPIETAPKDGTPILARMLWYPRGLHGREEYAERYFDILRWTTFNGGGWVHYMLGQPTHWMPLPPPPINQEVGDAPETAGQNTSSKVGGDVATPAPGENSERAEDWVYGWDDKVAQKIATGPYTGWKAKYGWEVILTSLEEDIATERHNCFTAGRRSMREEAETVVLKQRDRHHYTNPAWPNFDQAAAAIRAIPEKQSMAEVDPNAWAFKNGLESP